MVVPGLKPLKIVHKDYRDASKQVRIQFSEELDSGIDLSTLSVRLLQSDNITEIPFKTDRIEIEKLYFIVIELTPEVEEVERGIIEVKFMNKTEMKMISAKDTCGANA